MFKASWTSKLWQGTLWLTTEDRLTFKAVIPTKNPYGLRCYISRENLLSKSSRPVLLFSPKNRLGHPENYLFVLSKKYFFWIKVSKKMFYLILKTEALELTYVPRWRWADTGSWLRLWRTHIAAKIKRLRCTGCGRFIGHGQGDFIERCWALPNRFHRAMDPPIIQHDTCHLDPA